jgi:hypothetical protein
VLQVLPVVEPRVLEGLLAGGPQDGVRAEQAADEVASLRADVTPGVNVINLF